jgi:hypothetical protein
MCLPPSLFRDILMAANIVAPDEGAFRESDFFDGGESVSVTDADNLVIHFRVQNRRREVRPQTLYSVMAAPSDHHC